MLKLLSTLASASVASAALQAIVASDGSYHIEVDGQTWFKSAEDAYVLRYDGVTRSSAPGKGLKVSSINQINGIDPVLGIYSGSSININDGVMIANVYNYPSHNAVVFEQVFPSGLNNTAFPTGVVAANNLSTVSVVWSVCCDATKVTDGLCRGSKHNPGYSGNATLSHPLKSRIWQHHTLS